MKAISVSNLTKKYGDITAVNNITFDVEKNSFFAFLGKNGAGKSTTINIIATLLDMNEGDINVLGFKIGKDDKKIREKRSFNFVYLIKVLLKTNGKYVAFLYTLNTKNIFAIIWSSMFLVSQGRKRSSAVSYFGFIL